MFSLNLGKNAAQLMPLLNCFGGAQLSLLSSEYLAEICLNFSRAFNSVNQDISLDMFSYINVRDISLIGMSH